MLSVKAKERRSSSDTEREESPKEAVLRVSILYGAIIVRDGSVVPGVGDPLLWCEYPRIPEAMAKS